MWSKLFGSGSKDDKPSEADMAKAIRHVLADKNFMRELHGLAMQAPYSRLKTLVERAELAAQSGSAEEPGLSDRGTVQVAQQIVAALSDIAKPPRLRIEVADDPRGPWTILDDKDASGHRPSDYRRIAESLASKLRPHLPNPKTMSPPGGGTP